MTGVEVDGPFVVVGAGVIGAGWAALALAAGRDVVAHDPDPGAQVRLRAAVDAAWPALERLGLADGATRDRLRFVASLPEAVADAGFVQENGPERLDLKGALLAELDRRTPPEVVIASSSSGLLPSALQAMCPGHPERVLVGHPFHPVQLVPLVEVVPGSASSQGAVEAALACYRGLGKHPIVVRAELPGHVTNRLQAALWQEAYALVERGVVTVAEVDAAIAHGPGLRWALLGPLVNQHLSGGAGGLAHTLAHLGPPAQEWMRDLRPVELTPELAARLVAGVDDELAGVDEAELVRERDDLLVGLLAAKRTHPAIP